MAPLALVVGGVLLFLSVYVPARRAIKARLQAGPVTEREAERLVRATVAEIDGGTRVAVAIVLVLVGLLWLSLVGFVGLAS